MGKRTEAYIEHVLKELNLPEEARPQLGNWARVGTTLGALCLKLGLLDMEQINNLLELQEQTGGLFGDVAVELGYLNEEQVKKILLIQKWTRRTDILDRLFINGKIDENQIKHLSLALIDL